MKRRHSLALVISLAFVALGCEDPAAPSAAASASATVLAAKPTPTASASAKGPSYKDDAVFVPADFEDEAEQDITADNYKEKLDIEVSELDGKPADATSAGKESAPAP